MRTHIVVIGTGKLGQSILEETPAIAETLGTEINVQSWENFLISPSADIDKLMVVHVGSGRQLPETLAYCQSHGVPLIQGSTGMNQDTSFPEPLDFVYIEAPNLSLPIIKFMHALQQVGHLFKDFDIRLSESHQSTKKSSPGTAEMMADALGLKHEAIQSIRDPAKQRQLDIPEAYLTSHAAHWIEIEGFGGKLNFKTEILGHSAYIYGILELAKQMHRISPGRHQITSLVESGIL